MSFLDRYEFEQIIDEDLAISRTLDSSFNGVNLRALANSYNGGNPRNALARNGLSLNQRQAEKVNNFQQQLSPNQKRFRVNIGRTILLGLCTSILGLLLFHQPSFAQHSKLQGEPSALITQQQ